MVVNEDVTNLIQSSLGPDGFLTFAADNFVIALMMNKNTFNNHKIDTIIRPKKYIKCSELVKNKGIPITAYDYPLKRGLDSLILKPFEELIKSLKVPTYSNIDHL